VWNESSHILTIVGNPYWVGYYDPPPFHFFPSLSVYPSHKSTDSANATTAVGLKDTFSKAFVANDVNHEYVLKLPTAEEIVNAFSTSGSANPAFNLIQATTSNPGPLVEAADRSSKELVYASNTTDCVTCGSDGLSPNCFDMGQCGVNMADSLTKLKDAVAVSPEPDFDFLQRVENALTQPATYIDKMVEQSQPLTKALEAAYADFAGLDRLLKAMEPVRNAHGVVRRLADVRPDGTFDPKILPNINALWHKVYVYCSYSSSSGKDDSIGLRNCTDKTQLKKALTGIMRGGTAGSFSLTVVPDEVDEFFSEYVDPEWMEKQAPPDNLDCPGWSSFNVFVTSVQLNVFKMLEERWKLVDGNKDVLLTALNNAGYRDDITICDLQNVEVKTWVVPPSLEVAGDYDVKGNGGIGPSVAVTQPGLATLAATLIQGNTYTISVYNFPEGSTVAVRLMDGKTDPLDLSTPALHKFVNFKDDGPTSWEWTIPETLPEGEYYLKANNLQGNTAFSQLIEVAKKGTKVRRRLLI